MRIRAFDLECTSLSGMIGRVLCGVVKDIIPPEFKVKCEPRIYRGDDKKYRNIKDVVDDSKLCQAISEDLAGADVIVGHNSKLFDRKFLNARLVKAKMEPTRQQFHIDTMWLVRAHMRVSSKLVNLEQFLGLPDKKTDLLWDTWMRGAAFDKKAMDEIVQHCVMDVEVLEQAYWRLLPLARRIERT